MEIRTIEKFTSTCDECGKNTMHGKVSTKLLNEMKVEEKYSKMYCLDCTPKEYLDGIKD